MDSESDMELDKLPPKRIKEESDLRNGTLSEQRFECRYCHERFSSNYALHEHMRIHALSGTYSCCQCDHSFKTKVELQRHNDFHKGRTLFCDICSKGFSKTYNLKLHMDRMHFKKQRHKCDVCSKEYSTAGSLKCHMIIHNDDVYFECEYCKKRVNSQCSLKAHRQIHEGNKTYKCNKCGKCYARKHDLEKHFRSHTGERPYVCSYCEKRYTTYGDLNRHLRLHTGERPYKCDDCGNAFALSSSLVKHRRLHTGDKPYKCDVCQNAYYSSSALTRHMRIHTGDVVICYHCDRTFATNNHLQDHLHRLQRKSNHGLSKQSRKKNIRAKQIKLRSVNIENEDQPVQNVPAVPDASESETSKQATVTPTSAAQMHVGTCKKYTCKVCGKSFSCGSNLSKHQRRLHNVRPKETVYNCHVCDKYFIKQYNFRKHLDMHDSKRPGEDEKTEKNPRPKRRKTADQRTLHNSESKELHKEKDSCEVIKDTHRKEEIILVDGRKVYVEIDQANESLDESMSDESMDSDEDVPENNVSSAAVKPLASGIISTLGLKKYKPKKESVRKFKNLKRNSSKQIGYEKNTEKCVSSSLANSIVVISGSKTKSREAGFSSSEYFSITPVKATNKTGKDTGRKCNIKRIETLSDLDTFESDSGEDCSSYDTDGDGKDFTGHGFKTASLNHGKRKKLECDCCGEKFISPRKLFAHNERFHLHPDLT